MTVPFLTNEQFINLLKENGYEPAADAGEYFNNHDRIILIKNGVSFVVQYLPVYHFPQVVRTCLDLGIEPPEDHKKCFDQVQDQRRRKAESKKQQDK